MSSLNQRETATDCYFIFPPKRKTWAFLRRYDYVTSTTNLTPNELIIQDFIHPTIQLKYDYFWNKIKIKCNLRHINVINFKKAMRIRIIRIIRNNMLLTGLRNIACMLYGIILIFSFLYTFTRLKCGTNFIGFLRWNTK